jgi:hypothetical protein
MNRPWAAKPFAKRTQHEQQAHQLVLRAVLIVTMQGGQHEDVAAARVFQGPPLVFTVVTITST